MSEGLVPGIFLIAAPRPAARGPCHASFPLLAHSRSLQGRHKSTESGEKTSLLGWHRLRAQGTDPKTSLWQYLGLMRALRHPSSPLLTLGRVAGAGRSARRRCQCPSSPGTAGYTARFCFA